MRVEYGVLGSVYDICCDFRHDVLCALLSTVVVSFERAVYSVDEGNGTTEVCVILTGGPRTENISVRVETTPVPCVDSGRSVLIIFSQYKCKKLYS